MMKGIIFDLDGVIVSTDKIHYQAWNETCENWKIPFSPDINDKLRGVCRDECVEIILKHATISMSDATKTAFAEHKNKRFLELLTKLSSKDIMPGILELLAVLRDRDIKTAIGSSSKNAGTILEQINMKQAFDVVVDGTMIIHTKPNPEIFLLAANMLKLSPKHCAVIEDAQSGIIAAKRAGCIAIAIGEAGSHNWADYSLENTGQILDLLLSKEVLCETAI